MSGRWSVSLCRYDRTLFSVNDVTIYLLIATSVGLWWLLA
jgi:hypothetical protein